MMETRNAGRILVRRKFERRKEKDEGVVRKWTLQLIIF
jgi:hypothetical protein